MVGDCSKDHLTTNDVVVYNMSMKHKSLEKWLSNKNLNAKALDRLATKMTGISTNRGTTGKHRHRGWAISEAFKTTTGNKLTTDYRQKD